MSDEKCTDDQIAALEDIYDEIYLDGLQDQVLAAVGDYWADDINSAIASLDFAIRETISDMRRVCRLDL